MDQPDQNKHATSEPSFDPVTQKLSTERPILFENMLPRNSATPKATRLEPAYDAKKGILLILLAIPWPFLFFLFPTGAPFYALASCVLILMGVSRLKNTGKQPSVCPYCAYFDYVPPKVTEHRCPYCKRNAIRRGDWLYPDESETQPQQ